MSEHGPVVDFDHHTTEYATNGTAILRDLRERCPVAYSQHHGGMWVVSDYELVARVVRDDATYSSTYAPGTPFEGIVIPPNAAKRTLTPPIELDPPDFFAYRRALNPWFSPAAIERLLPRLRHVIDAVIDDAIESGRIDLVLDLANPVPAIITLEILGLPLDEWELWARPAHESVYSRPGSPELAKALVDLAALHPKLSEAITHRRRHPGDDLISFLTQVEVEGAALPDGEVLSIVNLLIHGGLDTTTALMTNALHYLDRDREARRRLIEDPALRRLACEEFLRWVSPIQTQARTVTRDVELGGCPLQAGDRVLVSWAGANRDDEVYEQPDEVVLDRYPNRHLAFGLGIHRCIGSHLARAEFAAVLDAVLARMPDYAVVQDEVVRYDTIGMVNGIVQMPATFTPGERVGATLS